MKKNEEKLRETEMEKQRTLVLRLMDVKSGVVLTIDFVSCFNYFLFVLTIEMFTRKNNQHVKKNMVNLLQILLLKILTEFCVS